MSAVTTERRRATCRRCGRTVWLKATGTIARSDRFPRDTKCYEWCARKGSKPRPIECPVPGEWPSMRHEVEGEPTGIFVLPDGTVRTV